MVALDLRAVIRQERQRRGAAAGKPCPTTDAAELAAGGCTLGSCSWEPADAAASDSNVCQSSAAAAASPRADAALVSRLHHLDVRQCVVTPEIMQGLCYVPDFISREQEAAALRCVDAAPSSRWVQSGERRLQNWGGRPGEAAVREALPPVLQALADAMVAARLVPAAAAPNHCLVNDYRGGAGIPPHRDGALYTPPVATLSLAGPALLQLHRAAPDGGQGALVAEVLLRPRCLLLMACEAYSDHLHSIATRPADTVSPLCCNAAAAGTEVGQVVPRAARRVSLVYVHKRRC